MFNQFFSRAFCSILALVTLSSSVWGGEFQSNLVLDVYQYSAGPEEDRLLGQTPTPDGDPIQVPDQGIWYVRPLGLKLTRAKVAELVDDLRVKGVPGLSLSPETNLDKSWLPDSTDEGLAALQRWSNIRFLQLAGTRANDISLGHIGRLRTLEYLDLQGTEITDASAQSMSGLVALQTLNLADTKISDKALGYFWGFAKLRSLDLSRTPITNAGIKKIRWLPRLQSLELAGTQVTDGVFVYLMNMERLQRVHLASTGVTAEGVNTFRAKYHRAFQRWPIVNFEEDPSESQKKPSLGDLSPERYDPDVDNSQEVPANPIELPTPSQQ